MKGSWIWMPHPGHLIVARDCKFHLNTFVNGYIVSTVGEYVPDSAVRKVIRESRGRTTTLIGDAEEADFGFQEIGLGRLYETMVFKAKKSNTTCCPYTVSDFSELDMNGYNDSGDAYKGHLAMCAKWEKK